MNRPAGTPSLAAVGARLSIAVVRGSISGCMTARMLMRAGYEVQVYERSPAGLVGRGGGVATSSQVIQSLHQEQLIGPDFPTVPHSHLHFAKRAAGHESIGRCPWRPELDMQCVHWSGLFHALRQGIDDRHYHLGRELVGVARRLKSAPAATSSVLSAGKSAVKSAAKTTADREPDAPQPSGALQLQLQFADGSCATADLLVFTDGFRSFGRRQLFPETALDYRGFAVWRGVVDESQCNAGTALSDHPRLSLASMPGSFVTYLMPAEDGSIRPGERVINWAVYLPVSDEELPRMMTDREGRVRQGTLPAGSFPLEQEQRLKILMREQLPSIYADIIEASVDTQFQPVFVSRVPAHYKDRLCLVGDAAVAIQPLTGAGVYKAFENARSLVSALEEVDQALQQQEPAPGSTPHTSHETGLDAVLARVMQSWSDTQVQLDDRLLATGYALEDAFIWNTIDLAIATNEQVQHWWQESVRFPADYSYLKPG